MRYFSITLVFYLFSFSLKSQSADSIIVQLKLINRAVVNKSCSGVKNSILIIRTVHKAMYRK